MAKSRTDDLFDRLHAQGLRKRTAKLLSQATDRRRKPVKAVERSLSDIKRAVAHVEDRLAGGPEKRKAAAKKAAATRKRNAQNRSAAAKKAARTRAKSS
ncbi:MAG: hypothetical protein ACXVFQ_17245 [Solirubrobacteraceae bacterium]